MRGETTLSSVRKNKVSATRFARFRFLCLTSAESSSQLIVLRFVCLAALGKVPPTAAKKAVMAQNLLKPNETRIGPTLKASLGDGVPAPPN
jgi:hypothetical protein